MRIYHFSGSLSASRALQLAQCLCLCLELAGCASGAPHSGWHLPWHRAAPASSDPVQELAVQSDSAVPLNVQQHWSRNTLRVDLGTVSGSGTMSLVPNVVNGWPARLELLLRADGITELSVQGAQREVFTLAPGAEQALAIAPALYPATSSALALSWQ